MTPTQHDQPDNRLDAGATQAAKPEPAKFVPEPCGGIPPGTTRVPNPPLLQHWDIACMVIDNFGDAGVAWRLARQLAVQRGYAVRLFIDDLSLLFRLIEGRLPEPTESIVSSWWPELPHGSVQVLHLDALDLLGAADHLPFADVIVETFACGLPQLVMERMAQAKRDGQTVPLWVNLDYLSAESWVEGCHGLHAAYMQGALSMGWFFPGFSARTGGLLREPEVADRAAQQAALEGDGQSDTMASRRRLAVLGPSAQKSQAEQILTYLFCYDRPEIKGLLNAMRTSCRSWKVLVPPGVAERCLRELGVEPGWHAAGQAVTLGALELQPVPFVPQHHFDDAIAGCDLILIRGEDSFVRAQWAAAPMLWHIYPQLDDAHQPKVHAFWATWDGGRLSDAARQALLAMSGLLNAPAAPSWPTVDLSTSKPVVPPEPWPDHVWSDTLDTLVDVLPELQQRALQWRAQLLSEPDLLSRLEHWLLQQSR